MAKRLLAETAGTFLLVLVGVGSVVLDGRTGGALGSVGIALAFAGIVATSVYAFGHVSGAHINPAVTVSFWSAGHFPSREVLPYVAAQCAGAIAAGFALLNTFGRTVRDGATVPHVPIIEAFLLEWLFSFLLMFMIAVVALGGRTSRSTGAFIIGIIVGFEAFVGGWATGASMNPARSLGPALAGGAWDAHWLYWIAPVTGMAGAIRVFELLAGKSRRSKREQAAEAAEAAERIGVEGPILAGDTPRSYLVNAPV